MTETYINVQYSMEQQLSVEEMKLPDFCKDRYSQRSKLHTCTSLFQQDHPGIHTMCSLCNDPANNLQSTHRYEIKFINVNIAFTIFNEKFNY